MTDRPIEHAVDGLQGARDEATRGVADVATRAKRATDDITRMVEAASGPTHERGESARANDRRQGDKNLTLPPRSRWLIDPGQ